MTIDPQVDDPSQPWREARSILMRLARTGGSFDVRCAAMDAVGALDDALPGDRVPPAQPERDGSLDDVLRLLATATAGEQDPVRLAGLAHAAGVIRSAVSSS